MDDSDAARAARLGELAQPLLELLVGGPRRIVARPHAVTSDDAYHLASPCEVAWSQAQHEALADELGTPTLLRRGVVGVALPDAIVLEALGPIELTALQLAERGMLSVLCARLLGAALDIGRNVLFTGPLDACLPLMAALVDEGLRPALLLGDSWQAHPPRWHLVDELSQAPRLGADRFAAWGLGHKALNRVMNQLTGVVAHVAGGRLERALTRFESGWNRPQQAPLGVLSSIDLVVVVQRGAAGPEVVEVAEILLANDGYRPQALFARGQLPVTQALSLCARPSWLAELAQRGHGTLAAELAYAALPSGAHAAPPASAAAPAPTPPPQPHDKDPEQLFAQARRLLAERDGQRDIRPGARARRPGGAARHAMPTAPVSAPGWELDLPGALDDATLTLPASDEEEQALQAEAQRPEAPRRPLSTEEATLAATFGLAPPPVPPGQANMAVEPPAATGFGEQGDEALRHHRPTK